MISTTHYRFNSQLNFHLVRSLSTIDVAGYIKKHVTPFIDEPTFLKGPTERTLALLSEIQLLAGEEQKKGILDVDPNIPSTIIAFPPGYIGKKENELIVGLQTDKPLKRSIKPQGGVGIVQMALESYGYKMNPQIKAIYSSIRKTHNAGVFDVYTDEMRAARKAGILTGLPDGYGRGRIIGDYRRVALYGIDALIESKCEELKSTLIGIMDEKNIQTREEVSDQIKALKDLKTMAASYGYDISNPATNSHEAVQWLYFAYLGAIKEQDGAAMSIGRIDGFLDIYFEKDLKAGVITEQHAQELIDDLVLKCRLVRQLRAPEYNALFSGDPSWVTMSIGGILDDAIPLVTKTTYRILNTLYNLGPAPEPNITVLWSKELPEHFKQYCARVSIDTSSIQYENDDTMRNKFGHDYAIACCVSAMRLGKDMQYFGARCNLPKLLLYTLNHGKDEISGAQIGPDFQPPQENAPWRQGLKGLPMRAGSPLDYDLVKESFEEGVKWLTYLYCNTMNVIHYMHDKYNYEKVQMALHDTDVNRLLAFGISGLSVVTDSLSAIKHAKVYPIYDDKGIIVDFRIEGEFPRYGNDCDDVDDIAKWVVTTVNSNLQKQTTYRNAKPTLSVLTITSNVVYGKMTGTTPDGRKSGEWFSPGANPSHGAETSGALASLNSVAKIPYSDCQDGISNTFTIVPTTLGKDEASKTHNLVNVLNGYFKKGGFHLNVNVIHREVLLDAIDHPEKYPNLTIRVSGYAVHFNKLTPTQQQEVIARTFHTEL